MERDERKQRVVEDRHKVYFHRGDSVRLKTVDADNDYVMRVSNIVWSTNNDGSLKILNNKKVIEGIMVEWLDSYGVMQYKLVDSRSIYKVEYSGQYHLIEAKKHFVKEGMTDIVEIINQALDKCI